MEYRRTEDILRIQRTLCHKKHPKHADFTVRVANNAEEACHLIEVGFKHVTGEYTDRSKIFKKRN